MSEIIVAQFRNNKVASFKKIFLEKKRGGDKTNQPPQPKIRCRILIFWKTSEKHQKRHQEDILFKKTPIFRGASTGTLFFFFLCLFTERFLGGFLGKKGHSLFESLLSLSLFLLFSSLFFFFFFWLLRGVWLILVFGLT